MDPGVILSGTSGAVLDPVFSLRRRVRIEPGASAIVAFTTAVADSREEALTLADHYRETSAVARAFELAWAHTPGRAPPSKLVGEDAHLFQRLASHVLYTGSTLRADAAVLAENRKGQPGLWPYGISGDKPIVVAFIADFDELVPGQCVARGPHLSPAQGARPRPRDPGRSSLRASSTSCTSTSSTWSRAATPRPGRQAGRDLRPQARAPARRGQDPDPGVRPGPSVRRSRHARRPARSDRAGQESAPKPSSPRPAPSGS